MSKSNKRFERVQFDDEKDIRHGKKAGRHARINNKQAEDEPEDQFDEDFKYASEVKYFLNK